MDKTTERQYSLASSHNAKSRRLTLHTARMVTRHQNRRYFGPPNHVGHHRDTTLLRQWLPRPRMAFIGNQTARYSLHQPVPSLLLFLHVDWQTSAKFTILLPNYSLKQTLTLSPGGFNIPAFTIPSNRGPDHPFLMPPHK